MLAVDRKEAIDRTISSSVCDVVSFRLLMQFVSLPSIRVRIMASMIMGVMLSNVV